MKNEFLSHFSMIEIPLIAEFIFLSIFIGCIFWVFRKGSKKLYQDISKLPLEKGAHHE